MEKLNALAAERKFKDAKELMLEYNSADIAAFLEEAGDSMVILFRLLPRDVAAEVFAYMDSEPLRKAHREYQRQRVVRCHQQPV